MAKVDGATIAFDTEEDYEEFMKCFYSKKDLIDDPDLYEMHQELTELYQPSNQAIFSTDEMPNAPIDPFSFVIKVQSELLSKGVCIANDLPLVLEEMCKLFNFIICSERDPYIRSYAYPAQTGIGKSVSLQVYVSMLQKESSLIIVAKVEEAQKYCEYINILSNNPGYARCYYALSDANPKHPMRVENHELKKYRCIVITHNMFKKVNQSVDMDLYKLYQNQPRDLIVIDEKLSFYEQFKVTYREIDLLIEKIKHVLQFSEASKNLKDSSKGLEFIVELKTYLESKEEEIITDPKSINIIDNNGYDIDEIADKDEIMVRFKESIKLEPKKVRKAKIRDKMIERFIELGMSLQEGIKPICLNFRNDIRVYFLDRGFDIEKSLDLIHEILNIRIEELFKELKMLGNQANPSYQKVIENNANQVVNNIKMIFEDDFLLYQSNYEKCIFRVNDITNKLGSSVVLDATASINEFYKVANRSFGHIGMVSATQIRKYENLTIYKAKGFNQSRSAIYKGKKQSELDQNAKMYLSYAVNVLGYSDDKMLIICHKDFKKSLEDNCTDARIVFTHWGDHVGRNEWSDCNKVMVIGWYYLNQLEHISNIANAAREIDLVVYRTDEHTIKNFEISQLADDLVQAVMRSKARIIDSVDADCKKTEMYLFYKEDEISLKVLELFESQFPQATVIDWIPVGMLQQKKKTIIEQRTDTIIALLLEKAKNNLTYMLDDIKEETSIKGANMTRVIESEYFNIQIKKHGFDLQYKNGKSKHFILQ